MKRLHTLFIFTAAMAAVLCPVNYAGCVLPDGQCVIEAGESGYLPEGKQEGAFRHLYGSIVTVGARTRVLVL